MAETSAVKILQLDHTEVMKNLHSSSQADLLHYDFSNNYISR